MIELMLRLLNKINESDLPNNYDKYLTNDPYNVTVEEVRILANSVLVDDNGHNNYDNHEILRSNGFYVFAGEQDRFGWLTGCIQTKKGIIVFG